MPPVLRPAVFDPPFPQIAGQLTAKSYAAICGPNNSGKSHILKSLKRHLGKAAYFAGPARFYHLSQIGTSKKNPAEYIHFENSFNINLNNEDFNFDENTIGLDRIISNLSNTKRQKLFDICGELIGNNFSMKLFEDDNDLSPRYIDMDGQNISVGSSGTRIVMTLIGLCMDDNFNFLLIDEPELGLGPKVQEQLSRFFSEQDIRKRHFPHLTSIYVATHSHLFLDRRNITNNFSIDKVGDTINFTSTDTMSALHNLQFSLLGNSLESLFLPSGFVFVEGKTDQPYIARIIKSKLPDKNVVVTQCSGNLKTRVHALKESLSNLDKSPFRSRIFVIMDSVVPNPSLKAELIAMGIVEENIVQWARNGIEYLYPRSIMAEIFSCGEDGVDGIGILEDNVSLNGIVKRKTELSSEVCSRMVEATQLPQELTEKFLNRLASAIQ